MQLLVVCTANRARSAMAAALLRHQLAGRDGVEVWSAGFASEDQPALAEAVAAMEEVGIDLRPHRSRLLDAGQCARADLVVAMTRRHVIDVALLSPETWPRTFPLRDLLERARGVGPRAEAEPVRDWVRRLHGERQRSELFALPPQTDVPDPVGAPLRTFVALREQLEAGVAELAGLLGGDPAP